MELKYLHKSRDLDPIKSRDCRTLLEESSTHSVILQTHYLDTKIRYHSTKTAILRTLSDIYSAIDQGGVSLLAFLDVSAVFDNIDHGIFRESLSTS